MTYNDLYVKALALIKENALNVSTSNVYDSRVPNEIRTTGSNTRKQDIHVGTYTYVNGPAKQQNWYNPGSATAAVHIYWDLIADSHLDVVSVDTVEQQLTNYLNSLGIPYTDTTTEVSTRGLINFYTNIASFLSVKLVQVCGQLTGNNKYKFYNSIDNVPAGYSLTNAMKTDYKITAVDVNNSLSSLKSSLPKISKLIMIRYNLQYSSTSSCSSSSSSSSSSSCSSSSCSSSSCSTIFIAYFNPSAV